MTDRRPHQEAKFFSTSPARNTIGAGGHRVVGGPEAGHTRVSWRMELHAHGHSHEIVNVIWQRPLADTE